MDETVFAARIQAQRRIVIPKRTFNVLNLYKGGTVEVTLRPVEVDSKNEDFVE